MESRNLNLTVEEIVAVVDALEGVYLRKIKKAQLMPEPRNVKTTEELKFYQVLMQRLMALANYDPEEIAADIRCGELGREEIEGTAKS